MRRNKKMLAFSAMLLLFIMVFSVTGSAAKLNKKKLTLTVGESFQMELLNLKTQKTVTWTSSDYVNAPVSVTGSIIARHPGIVTITAKAGKKTYDCVLTIKDQEQEPTVNGISANAQKLLSTLDKMTKQVKADVAAGKKWTYDNPNFKNSFTDEVAHVAKGGTGHSRCSHIVRWSLISIGVMPSGGNMYASTAVNGKVAFNDKSKNDAAFQGKIKIINAYKTPTQLLNEGNLLPGDICIWNAGFDHISIYAGNQTWYDAGRGSDGFWKNGTFYFNSFGPINGWMNTKVGQIVRLK